MQNYLPARAKSHWQTGYGPWPDSPLDPSVPHAVPMATQGPQSAYHRSVPPLVGLCYYTTCRDCISSVIFRR